MHIPVAGTNREKGENIPVAGTSAHASGSAHSQLCAQPTCPMTGVRAYVACRRSSWRSLSAQAPLPRSTRGLRPPPPV
eukprot:6333830-Pyramimonas_sp.AAC.1